MSNKYNYEQYVKAHKAWREKCEQFNKELDRNYNNSYGLKKFDECSYRVHNFNKNNPEPRLEDFK